MSQFAQLASSSARVIHGIMRRRLWSACVPLLLGCSTIDPGPGPGEDGMYAEEAGLEGDGVLVQCGNLDAKNYYWQTQVSGVLEVLEMPVVCVGSIDTPGFDYDAAVAVDGHNQFPEVEADIQVQCAAACEAVHEAGTG